MKVENIKKSAIATVKCGHCGLSKDVLVNSISEPVDAFGDFIDMYYADAELQRIEKRVEKLAKDNEWGELAFCYSILSDICKAKAAESLEDDDNIDLDVANKWKLKSEQYKRKEKDALLSIRLMPKITTMPYPLRRQRTVISFWEFTLRTSPITSRRTLPPIQKLKAEAPASIWRIRLCPCCRRNFPMTSAALNLQRRDFASAVL